MPAVHFSPKHDGKINTIPTLAVRIFSSEVIIGALEIGYADFNLTMQCSMIGNLQFYITLNLDNTCLTRRASLLSIRLS